MLVALGAALLLLAACSGDETSEPTDGTTDDSLGVVQVNEGDGTFVVGALLPETGPISPLGRSALAGVQLALEEIDAAGGVLGRDVAPLVSADEGAPGSDDVLDATEVLLDAGVDVIVGPAASSATEGVLAETVPAGVLVVSPVSTDPSLRDLPDDGLYLRTAPSALLHVSLLAELAADEGHTRLAVVAPQELAGVALFAGTSFEATGGSVVAQATYAPGADDHSSVAQEVASASPDAVVVLGESASGAVVAALSGAGVGPGDVDTYASDGARGSRFVGAFTGAGGDVASLEGTVVTYPDAPLTQLFREQLLAVDPELTDLRFAAHAHDATIVAALAAGVAGTDAPAEVAAAVPSVVQDGTTCRSYEQCVELVEAGADLAYEGAVGPLRFDERGDPAVASYAVTRYGADGTLGLPAHTIVDT